jgi:hypothetical protein
MPTLGPGALGEKTLCKAQQEEMRPHGDEVTAHFPMDRTSLTGCGGLTPTLVTVR